MKTKKTFIQTTFILLAGLAAFFYAGMGQVKADDHDHNGFWDTNHHYHHYEYYHNHRGYWDERNGVRVWINIG